MGATSKNSPTPLRTTTNILSNLPPPSPVPVPKCIKTTPWVSPISSQMLASAFSTAGRPPVHTSLDTLLPKPTLHPSKLSQPPQILPSTHTQQDGTSTSLHTLRSSPLSLVTLPSHTQPTAQMSQRSP